MKTIIAGGREITDMGVLLAALAACGWQDEITEVVSGRAFGADDLGERWAKARGLRVQPFPANWWKYGNAAGPRRNREMAAYADALVALDSGGNGTADVIKQARQQGLRVFVWPVAPTPERVAQRRHPWGL